MQVRQAEGRGVDGVNAAVDGDVARDERVGARVRGAAFGGVQWVLEEGHVEFAELREELEIFLWIALWRAVGEVFVVWVGEADMTVKGFGAECGGC